MYWYITCPVTQQPTCTGMRMDAASWARSEITNATVRCTQCGQQHAWTKDQAWPSAQVPPARTQAA